MARGLPPRSVPQSRAATPAPGDEPGPRCRRLRLPEGDPTGLTIFARVWFREHRCEAARRQMSMPKRVRAEHGDRNSLGPPGPRRRRSSTPGCSSWTRSHPPPASVLPESAARKVPALVRRAHIPDTCAASGPGSATWKDPDPRRRSSRGSGGSEQACLPGDGGYATPAACPVTTTSWRYGLRRTCRLVNGRSHRPRSTWPTRPG
jgi:hypothetical protein